MTLQGIKQRFGIIGNSPALNYALEVAMRVAPTDLTVLITGESGVGKEVFSQIIHQLSTRKHEKFIAVNCGAIPEGTIDSELFGHEKGSFTGADDKRKGYFETVDGGTIFLDEIGEMPIGTQARLLRVLETGEFLKVGSSKPQKTIVRVVAATNVDLLENVVKGKFREDLYYRLSTVPIEIPPLRERGNDMLLLFRKFVNDFADKNSMKPVRLSPEAEEVLKRYNFPGNVRQLKNIAEQISVLSTEHIITSVELEKVIPDITQRRLPMLSKYQNNQSNFSGDNQLLYKLFFELKKDINDIKQFLLQSSSGYQPNFQEAQSNLEMSMDDNSYNKYEERSNGDFESSNSPIILNDDHEFHETEAIEEMLSLADMEKEMISKALEKHNGKRKDASSELGISERTLYRKIKEYSISK